MVLLLADSLVLHFRLRDATLGRAFSAGAAAAAAAAVDVAVSIVLRGETEL